MPIDDEISALIERAALRWLVLPDRPKVDEDTLAGWDALVEAWLDEETMPLLVRKSGKDAPPKGVPALHASGREVVCVDNAPANWCLSTALQRRVPSLDEIRSDLEAGSFPTMRIPTGGSMAGGAASCCVTMAS